MARELSQDFLNRVELHYERLLPAGMSRRSREAAKSVLRPLYDEGASAKLASRFLCAVDADDPSKCVIPLPDSPRPSRDKAARQPAAAVELPEPGQVKLAIPRKGSASKRRAPAKGRQLRPAPASSKREVSESSPAAPAQASTAASARPAPVAKSARQEALPGRSNRAATALVPTASQRTPGASPRTLRPIVAALGWLRTAAGPDRLQVVTWEPERETNGFLLALGGSGSGKSELLKALAYRAGDSVPVIVLDFHGDLTGLRLPEYLAGRAGVSINPLALVSTDPQYGGPIPQTEAVIDAVRRAAPGFGRLQEVGLRDAILATYKAAHIGDDPASWSRPAPRLADIREQIRTALQDPARRLDHRSLSGVLAAIDAAFSDAAFRGEGELPLGELLRAGGHLDLSRLSRSAQILAADSLLRQIFGRLRSQGVATQPGRYRVLVIADEASILKGAAILDELFKEARKFGLALVLASQESSDFSSAVRANAATLIALRTNSAKEAAEYSRELSHVTAAQILQLTGPGDGYLRNQSGTRRIQVAPTSVALSLSRAPYQAAVPPTAQERTTPAPLGKSGDPAREPDPVKKPACACSHGAATRQPESGFAASSAVANEPPPAPAPAPGAGGNSSKNLESSARGPAPEARPQPATAPEPAATRASSSAPEATEAVAKRYAAGRVWIAGKTKKPPGKGQIERWEPIVARKLADPAIADKPDQRAFWEGVRDFLAEAKAARDAKAGAAPATTARPAPTPTTGHLSDRTRRAAKLRQLASSLDKQIASLRDSGTHHQRPTARRARIAAGQDQQADRLEQVRAALVGLARALEGDCLPASLQAADQGERECLPASLQGIDTKLIVEELLGSEKFPLPGIRLHWLNDLITATAGARSLASERAAAVAIVKRCGEHWCGIQDLSDIAAIEKLAAALKSDSKTRRAAEESLRYLLPFKRALAAGIHSQEEWAQARADLVRLGKPAPQATPTERLIRDQERNLIGQKIPGYFPTPKALAARVVAEAQLVPGLRVLEPEAGKGDIAAAIRAAGIEPDVIELNATLRALLELKGFRVVATDFLEYQETYDRILMNPPFEGNQDIRHVRHAFDLLRPGGRLVALMGEGAFFRQGHEEQAFRFWLEDNQGKSEKLPPGSFLQSDRSTGVATRLLTIDKMDRRPAPPARPIAPAASSSPAVSRAATPAAPAARAAGGPAAARSAATAAAPRAIGNCPPGNPSCKLGLLGGACGLPAALVLAAPVGAPVPQTARYCLASARKLIASHDPRTFSPRADYPADVQERRYDADKGEQLKVLRIAEDLNPAIIFNTIPSVTDGTPVVTEAGIVLGGNGRTLGLQRHYLDGGGKAKPYLVDHAAEFGFSAEDVEALPDPVVVRVVDPETRGLSETAAKRRLQQLVRVLNVPLIKELDQQASAVALARQLDEGVFNTLATALDDDKTLAEYLHSARSRELVVELQRVGVFRETNLSAYVGSAGFTESGRRLLEKTLAASLVEDASVLEALGEGTQATLARGAPWLVAATAYGADWDVRPTFLAAARDVLTIRKAQIRTVGEYLRQSSLFAAEAPPSSRLAGGTVVLQVLAELASAPLRFARFARSYYDDARQNLSSQGALFAAEKILPGEALKRAAKAAGVDLLSENADALGNS